MAARGRGFPHDPADMKPKNAGLIYGVFSRPSQSRIGNIERDVKISSRDGFGDGIMSLPDSQVLRRPEDIGGRVDWEVALAVMNYQDCGGRWNAGNDSEYDLLRFRIIGQAGARFAAPLPDDT